MQLKKVPLAKTHAFTPFFLDYVDQKTSLKPFFGRFPTIDNFKPQIEEKQKSFKQESRDVLVRVLKSQYAHLKISDAVSSSIDSLKDQNTFTITTGHQLNIFTGPLYFIYKIVTIINACKQLKVAYPAYNFIPVYWMASEDHDYEEIKYFRLYGKKYTWETDQKGAVGRFHTNGFDKLLNELPGDVTLFREAYLKNSKLSDAVRSYVNALFAGEGLVVIDADNKELKSLFKKVIYDDVINCATLPLVDEDNKKLEALGYKTQIFCRDINFFYLDGQIRERIEKENETYKVLGTTLRFSAEEMKKLVEAHPEKFSPNVILRPLYQEVILPNIAYTGGPAEVIYWLQLKSVFDKHNTPFPILLPRNFAMVIDHPVERKFEKLKFSHEELFEDKNFLFNDWTLKHANHKLGVGDERTVVLETFDKLKARASAIDPTLGPFLGAEGKRALNSLEKIERKMLRAEKRLQADKLRQIEEVKDALFPNGSLQERTDNFLNFYQRDNAFISKLLMYLDPFDLRFHILTYSGHE
ncbi:MAG TPA: bacillithiol biosynthesis cysteine-adding enzyme BshC [Chryseosolibacter sp.]